MKVATRSKAAGGARRQRSARAQAILVRHFDFSGSAVESYLTGAAQREGRKVSEIENAVLRLARDLF